MTTSCDFLGKLLWFSCKQSTVHFWISVYNPKQPVLHSLPCFIYYYIFSLITVATPKGSSQSATRTCLSLICVKIRIFTKHSGWFQYFISKTFLLNSKELLFFLFIYFILSIPTVFVNNRFTFRFTSFRFAPVNKKKLEVTDAKLRTFPLPP